MKRVLLIGNFLSNYINRSVCEGLAMHFEDNGWHVITASNRLNRVLRLIDMVQTTWSKRYNYDVAQVDVYSGASFIWAEIVCWLLRRAGKPYVLTLHGGNLPAFSRRWPKRVKYLLCTASVVTAPSHYLLDQMSAYRGDIRYIPNALEISMYSFRLRDQPQPRLVWIRAFQDTYNPTLAPKVVSILSKKFPKIQLIMVGPDKGDGSYQKTQQMAVSLGVNNQIVFSGGIKKAEVPIWLNKGDIFINTTNVDNAPVSVLEAMTCGLCVTSTNVGGIPYLLEHEHDSLLVSPNDPYSMAEAISRILLEPGLAERLSLNARIKAEKFDWANILLQWESLLKAVIERPNNR